MLNYGDLTVTGTGGAREVFARVHDPVSFRNEVQRASARPVRVKFDVAILATEPLRTSSARSSSPSASAMTPPGSPTRT